ncbi:Panacea domain-containing protein [Ensifer sp. B1-9]|uniref:Panacea domain-containing protein n=1 Tax=Ensifer sp. B1-9 TaxID=3141455 RepID=UPI003D257FBA
MNANDVAKYILRIKGPMSAMKLQKLVYYCQAWSLVWDDRPMFDDRIEAWANGPVCVNLYNSHRGRYTVEAAHIPGDTSQLDVTARETIQVVQ